MGSHERPGTIPWNDQLPEAQVDRFLLKVIIDYPTLEEEKLIIRENIQGGLPEVCLLYTSPSHRADSCR